MFINYVHHETTTTCCVYPDGPGAVFINLAKVFDMLDLTILCYKSFYYYLPYNRLISNEFNFRNIRKTLIVRKFNSSNITCICACLCS